MIASRSLALSLCPSLLVRRFHPNSICLSWLHNAQTSSRYAIYTADTHSSSIATSNSSTSKQWTNSRSFTHWARWAQCVNGVALRFSLSFWWPTIVWLWVLRREMNFCNAYVLVLRLTNGITSVCVCVCREQQTDRKGKKTNPLFVCVSVCDVLFVIIYYLIRFSEYYSSYLV